MPSSFQYCDLTGLIDAVGADFQLARDLLDEFVTQLDDFTLVAPKLAVEQRAQDFSRTVHSFKGALLVVGAEDLARTLRDWEESASRGQVLPREDEFEQVGGVLANLRAEVAGFIAMRDQS